MTEKLYKNRDWMFEMYIQRHRSLETIAWECGCSKMTISRMLRKHGIKARDRVEAVRNRFRK